MGKLGREFELAVAKIQQILAPDAEVKTNVFLTDRIGQKREFDVTFKTVTCSHHLLGVIECKDLNKPVDVQVVDAFVTKSTDINANIKVLVSKCGFTKKAIDKAKFNGILVYSLLPNDDLNFDFGLYITARLFWFKKLNIQIFLTHDKPVSIKFKASDVLLDGKKVIDWYKNYIVKNYKLSEDIGYAMGVNVKFTDPVNVVVKNRMLEVQELQFSSLIALDERSKLFQVNGNGFYDWHDKTMKTVDNQGVDVGLIHTDFIKWPKKRKNTSHKEMSFSISSHSALEFVDDAIVLENYP